MKISQAIPFSLNKVFPRVYFESNVILEMQEIEIKF